LPELLRAEEAARYLGISKGLVYEMVKRHELPSTKLGRLLRIPRSGLDQVKK
jgi:excisionase family DNA binding protein